MNAPAVIARCRFVGFFALTVCLANCAAAQQATIARKPVTANRLPSDASFARANALPESWREHPLAPALEFAHARHRFIRENVRDFTCVLAKRERIRGRLRGYEYLATKVRREQPGGESVREPFSVFCRYLGPAKYAGRRVLFVDGLNEGKMLVRNGGQRFDYVTVRVAPDSEAARRESRYPITELGLENVARRLIEQAMADIRNDPAGANTEVTFFRDAKVDGRTCTQIQVVHPQPSEKLTFHLAKIYVDDQLHVPIRIAGYDWPDEQGEPVLLEEYTYMRLKINVGLTDADFSPELLQN